MKNKIKKQIEEKVCKEIKGKYDYIYENEDDEKLFMQGMKKTIELTSKQAEKDIIEKIDWEIKDCKTLIQLEENIILNAKTHKDYKAIIGNMQSVLENKHTLYRLKKLKQKVELLKSIGDEE